jgi:hypothetical protein
LQRLSFLKRGHADEQFLARRSLRTLPDAIDGLSRRLSDLSSDLANATAYAGRPLTVGNDAVSREGEAEALGKCLDSLPAAVPETRRFRLGVYRGLYFGIVLHPHYAPEVYLEGAATRQAPLSREHRGPRAVLNTLNRLAGGYGPECDRLRQDLEIARAQLRDYQARLGAPFPHDAYLAELTGLRDRLQAGLSGAAPEGGGPAAELAGQVKALMAALRVEATPARAGGRRPEAEEPVTARIRRRTGEPDASEGAWQQKLAEETAAAAGRIGGPG